MNIRTFVAKCVMLKLCAFKDLFVRFDGNNDSKSSKAVKYVLIGLKRPCFLKFKRSSGPQ